MECKKKHMSEFCICDTVIDNIKDIDQQMNNAFNCIGAGNVYNCLKQGKIQQIVGDLPRGYTDDNAVEMIKNIFKPNAISDAILEVSCQQQLTCFIKNCKKCKGENSMVIM
jgi:hypothetical protein